MGQAPQSFQRCGHRQMEEGNAVRVPLLGSNTQGAISMYCVALQSLRSSLRLGGIACPHGRTECNGLAMRSLALSGFARPESPKPRALTWATICCPFRAFPTPAHPQYNILSILFILSRSPARSFRSPLLQERRVPKAGSRQDGQDDDSVFGLGWVRPKGSR
jgi:hypothetical protein